MTDTGQPVEFVGDPAIAPQTRECVFARPDDVSANGKTWRDVLAAYNARPTENPLNLLPAFRLYENPVYERLVEKFGISNVYILSAGWGLISAGFLTPHYDITFSPAVKKHEKYKLRHKRDTYRDFCMLSMDSEAELICIASKEYHSLFVELTAKYGGRRTIFHNTSAPPEVSGCIVKHFSTHNVRKWPYECAEALLTNCP